MFIFFFQVDYFGGFLGTILGIRVTKLLLSQGLYLTTAEKASVHIYLELFHSYKMFSVPKNTK